MKRNDKLTWSSTFFIKMVGNDIVDVQSIDDMYTEVSVRFSATNVSESQLIEWLKTMYGSSWARKGASYIEQLDKENYFTLSSEAKDMPNIGNISTTILNDVPVPHNLIVDSITKVNT